MNEMVERVASVLFEYAQQHDSPFHQESWLQYARAAIEAMREPTEHVSEAMSLHAANGMVDWRDLHKAMIDEALK